MREDEFFDAIYKVSHFAHRRLIELYYRAEHDKGYAEEIIFDKEEIKRRETPIEVLKGLFAWTETPEGFWFWDHLSKDLDRQKDNN